MNIKLIAQKYKDNLYYYMLNTHLKSSSSVLDVGCGENSLLRYVKKHFKSEGVDIYKPSIQESKKRKIHDTYKIIDILEIQKFYKPKSFDAVIALDVIEHFSKKDALRLIKNMERIAVKKVIMLTPRGFHHQHHCQGNPYQEHKSGWEKEDLEKLGYKVYGLRGLWFIRGENASIRFKPWLFWALLAYVTEPLLFFFPKFSHHLYAVKKIS